MIKPIPNQIDLKELFLKDFEGTVNRGQLKALKLQKSKKRKEIYLKMD